MSKLLRELANYGMDVNVSPEAKSLVTTNRKSRGREKGKRHRTTFDHRFVDNIRGIGRRGLSIQKKVWGK